MLAFCSRPRKIIWLAAVFAAALPLSGCIRSENVPPEQTNVNANSLPAANSASPSPVVSESLAANTPVTLPLLDAMLADEAFANEARLAVQLTDQEIQKLRDVSRNAVLNLTEDPADLDSRSTKAAVDEARKQIQQVLGEERAGRFVSLVQLRWTGGEELPTLKPNAVPADTRIVVNTPAYRMDIFDKGKLVKSYKIGIGYPEFPLPTGLRKAKAIIFNPTWTPPDEPWVKGKVSPGKKVEAGSKLNPLGPIKIPIGSPSLIHGGKSPASMGSFASHGCVGLTSPQVQDFAMRISQLSGQPLTLRDIKAYEKAETETKNVKLDVEIPVELRYETIVVENGVLKIYRDVYEKGTNTEENLRRVLENFGVSLDDLKPADKDKILAGLGQMASNAAGRRVADPNPSNTKARSKSNDGRVTRGVKGKKEFVFKLAELAGKGYPAPVGIKM